MTDKEKIEDLESIIETLEDNVIDLKDEIYNLENEPCEDCENRDEQITELDKIRESLSPIINANGMGFMPDLSEEDLKKAIMEISEITM